MHEPNLEEIQKEYKGSLASYVKGFVASTLLTLLAFGLVIFKLLALKTLIYTIVILALLQASVQLHYFLKLGFEEKPKWESIIFTFMFIILLVIALGSLWIMFDLDQRLMVM